MHPLLTRRDWLRVGTAGLCGLSLPNLLRAEAEQGLLPGAKAKNVIFYWCQGGPPHQDMWDLKPTARAEIRGEFKGIDSAIPGYQVCELLPRLATMVDRLTILRGVNHHIPDHNPGSMFMLGSGNPPNPTTFHPTWSAVVKKEFPKAPGVPTTVAVPSEPGEGPGPGFLGVGYRSFETQGDPVAENYQVRSMTMSAGIDAGRLQRRRELLAGTNRYFDELDHKPDLLRGLDKFYADAHDIILSEPVRAFRMDEEWAQRRDVYGRTKLGQRMLQARRLIEAGVRFVTISEPVGWDTHDNHFKRSRENLPVVDQALAALLTDLQERGLFEETLVMMFGEFGRTPKINKQAGRDHWPQAMSIVLAGGGVPHGLIYGRTDNLGAFVTEASHSPADFACTVYRLLGIDPHKTYPAGNGQPTPIVRGGEPIRAVLG